MPRLAALATQLLSTTYRVVISTTETAKLGLFAGLAALYGLVALLIDMFVGAPAAFYRAVPRVAEVLDHSDAGCIASGV